MNISVHAWLQQAQATLTACEVPTARLDSLVLLEDALGVDRAKLLAHPDMEIPSDTQNVLTMRLARRAQHVPLAFIRGKSEFYGREFVVSPAVLEPRPESEAMIELLLAFANKIREQVQDDESLCIADVGTGSGALGITVKLELPEASVELLEIDDAAIEVARTNVIKFTAGIPVVKTDLLDGSSQNYHVLLCNLPYVPDDYPINRAAKHEPAIALFGGADGLDLYRKLFAQLVTLPTKPLLILTESLLSQHDALAALASTHGYQQIQNSDLIQAFELQT